MRRSLVPLALLVAAPVHAQEAAPQQPSPEQMQQIMSATFASMVPYMAKMTEAIIATQLDVAARPETADKIARYARNLYDALVKQGFTKDEALRIVTSVSMPSAAPPQQ